MRQKSTYPNLRSLNGNRFLQYALVSALTVLLVLGGSGCGNEDVAEPERASGDTDDDERPSLQRTRSRRAIRSIEVDDGPTLSVEHEFDYDSERRLERVESSSELVTGNLTLFFERTTSVAYENGRVSTVEHTSEVRGDNNEIFVSTYMFVYEGSRLVEVIETREPDDPEDEPSVLVTELDYEDDRLTVIETEPAEDDGFGFERVEFEYDADGRIESIRSFDPTGDDSFVREAAFDFDENLLEEIELGRDDYEFDYDDDRVDEINVSTGDELEFEYDNEGLIKRIDRSGDDAGAELEVEYEDFDVVGFSFTLEDDVQESDIARYIDVEGRTFSSPDPISRILNQIWFVE